MNTGLVIDCETQYTFQEVGLNPSKLKISVVGAFDYKNNEYRCYREKELPELFRAMEHAEKIIGFNIRKFDLPVMSPYYLGDLGQFTVIDLLEMVEKSLGHRVSLDHLAQSTLGTKKSGHGFLAIEYFRKGEWDKLEKYCLDDVVITKNLYEFALKNQKLHYQNFSGKVIDIPIILSGSPENARTVSLSLPF